MKNIFYYLIILVAFMHSSSNVLVLSPYSSIDSEFLHENDIETINTLFVDALKQYIDDIDVSNDICSDYDCALKALS